MSNCIVRNWQSVAATGLPPTAEVIRTTLSVPILGNSFFSRSSSPSQISATLSFYPYHYLGSTEHPA